MTLSSDVKIPGKHQGTKVPILPKITPTIAPMITRDFSSVLACVTIQTFRKLTGPKKKQRESKADRQLDIDH